MAEEKPKVHFMSWALYYVVLFFAYWFGASRFDMDGDGDFDPEDVEAYLADKGYLHSNFKQSRTAKKKGDKTTKGQQGASVVGKPQAEGGMDPAAGEEDPGAMNFFAAPVEGEAEEEEVVEKLLHGQIHPWFIIFECVVVFLLWLVCALITASKEGGDPLKKKAGLDTFAPDMTDLRLSDSDCADYKWQVWRWLTYQFTHVGAMHVLMNIFLNVMLGIPLEGLHGNFRMILMFNVGVLGGACCYIVNDAHTAVVGCSGGCYALIGMHFGDLIMNWAQKKFRFATCAFLVILVSTDVFSYYMSLSAENASGSAHFGGFVSGLIIAVLIGKNLVLTAPEKACMGCAAFTGFFLFGFAIIWNAYYWAPYNIYELARDEQPYCWVRQVYNATIKEDRWLCVRCGDQDCIKHWAPMLASRVSTAVCNEVGWHHDGR